MSLPTEFIALDFETTGFSPARDEIIEIGAVRFRNGEEAETFETLVRPLGPIPKIIVRKTGILPSQLASAPALSDVCKGFLAFLGEAPLVAHQARFEVGFLRGRFDFAPREIHDTMKLARAAGLKRCGLSVVAADLGIDSQEWHRALSDARATGRIFLALARLNPERASPRRAERHDATNAPSWEETRAACFAGHTPEEIATQRGLTVGTIEIHIEALIEEGSLSIEGLLPPSRIEAAERAWEAAGWNALLSVAHVRGGGDVSFRELRWARAHRRRSGRVRPPL